MTDVLVAATPTGLVALAPDGGLPAPGDIDVTDARVVGRWAGRDVWAGTVDPTAHGLLPWGDVCLAVGAPLDVAVARGAYDVRWRATHRFCGECGGPLVDCPGFPTRRCPDCVTRPYVGRLLAPVVIVAVHRGDDELLLVQHHAALWALVAGYVDPGETLEQAVAREVFEEVGIEVTDIRYVGSKGWSLDDPGVLMAAFTARCAPGAEPAADGVELSAARFFTRADLPANRPAAHSFAAPLIAAFESGGSGGTGAAPR